MDKKYKTKQSRVLNLLWPWCHKLPDGTKPLTEPVLAFQSGPISISQEIPQSLVTKVFLKNTSLNFYYNLPVVNKLIHTTL